MKKTVARPIGASMIVVGLAIAMAGLFSSSASADTGAGGGPSAAVASNPSASQPAAGPSAAPTTAPASAAPPAAPTAGSTRTTRPTGAPSPRVRAASTTHSRLAAKAAIRPAAVIDGAITNVTITQQSAGQFQAMQVNLDWSVPDTAKPGDTFSLTLPPELVSNTSSFDLRAPDGSVVATCSVVNGVATFTLQDYVATHKGVSGTAFFSVGWASSQSTVTGPVHLVFTAGTKPFPVTVTHNGPGGSATAPQKSGNWVDKNHQGGPDSIVWRVLTPVGPFTSAQLSDVAGPGQSIDCTTLKFRLGSNLDATGKPTSVRKLPSKDISGLTCAASAISATVGPVGAGQDVELVYLSSVLAGSNGTYPNSVTMTVDGTTFKTVTATVRVQNSGGDGNGSSTSPTSTATASTSTSSSSTTSTPSATVKAVALTSSSPGTLPFTGTNLVPMLALAALLLIGGAALLVKFSPSGERRH